MGKRRALVKNVWECKDNRQGQPSFGCCGMIEVHLSRWPSSSALQFSLVQMETSAERW